MRMPRIYRMLLTAMLLLVSLSIFSAIAAANTVGVSGADDTSLGINANDLKPAECSSLNLTNVITGSGLFLGSGDGDLILGSSGTDWILALNGGDCVLGGGGGDILWGNANNDVLLGGAGNDSLRGGDGTDVCYGGQGNDTQDGTCETFYQ